MSQIEQYLKGPNTFIPAVVGYLVKDNQVLLGLRKKVSLGLGENLISGIGGKNEAGETPEEALKREVLEEIEVETTSSQNVGRIRFIFPHQPKWNQDVTVFLVDSWEGEPKETEPIKPFWFPKNKLPKHQMWDDNAYWVPRVLDGKKVEGTFIFNEANKVIEHQLEVRTI